MAHAVLHHQFLHFMKYLALWGVEPAVTHQASWLASRGIHGERQTQAGGSFLLLVTWVAVQPPRAQLVCASKVVCRPPQSAASSLRCSSHTHNVQHAHGTGLELKTQCQQFRTSLSYCNLFTGVVFATLAFCSVVLHDINTRYQTCSVEAAA